LPRSDAVTALVRAVEAGEPVSPTEFDATIRDAVSEVVRRQREVGLTVINDGEQSKFSFQSYFKRRLAGFESRRVPARMPIAAEAGDFPGYFARWNFSGGSPTMPQAVCTGPIEYLDRVGLQTDLDNLAAAAAGSGSADVFMSAISPGTVVRITPNEHYPDQDEYETALCDALKIEYDAIVEAGVLLQIDCPDFGVYPRAIAMTGDEHRRLVARNVELLDYATRDIDPERMRFHVCWGADEAPHHLDVPLADMVDLLLAARPAGMTIAGANGRHEFEWKVWEDVALPEGKVLVPGVIDSTTNIVEHPATVAERIMRYASVLGRENVIAGVDCGLDTVAGVHQVDPEVAWAKLASLVEGARLASAVLWR
jgi:5-methyltetrahydropteroyltriglutamate--homocysteine methyltransferase